MPSMPLGSLHPTAPEVALVANSSSVQMLPTVLWDIPEGICILVRRGHRGIHPIAVTIIDCLLWIGFVVIAYFLSDAGFADDPFDVLPAAYSDTGQRETTTQELIDEVLGKRRAMISFCSILA